MELLLTRKHHTLPHGMGTPHWGPHRTTTLTILIWMTITPISPSWPCRILPSGHFLSNTTTFLPSLGFFGDLFLYNPLSPPSSAPHLCFSGNIISPAALAFCPAPATAWQTQHINFGISPITPCCIILTNFPPITHCDGYPIFHPLYFSE